MMQDLDNEDPKGKGTGKRRKSQAPDTPTGEEGDAKVPKTKKPRRTKSGSTIKTTADDDKDEDGEYKAPTPAAKKRGRPRRDTASSASYSETTTDPLPADELDGATGSAQQEIAIPKNGLRGSATGVVGAGKRKKAALTAWRNSTKSKDLGPG